MTEIFRPSILVVERVTSYREQINQEKSHETDSVVRERIPVVGFGPFGLFEGIEEYVLPPGEWATYEAEDFDKFGFAKAYKLRHRKPRLKVAQQPAERTLETL